MNISPTNLETIKYVKIGKVADYFRTKQWIKEGQISERASVWTKTLSPEGKIEFFLPLQSQAPDFFRRMTEVLETLEIVEQISQTEILNDLISTSQIASKMGREILKLKLSLSDPTTEEIPISNLGKIIDTLQSVINAIGQAKDGTPTMKGAIPQKIIDQTKLSVFGSFVGSFRLKLAASEPPSQTELLKEPLVMNTIDEFLELIRDSDNPEKLHKRLLNLKNVLPPAILNSFSLY